MKINPLAIDLYELTMAQVYYKYKRNIKATFELFIRSPKRPFYVISGIQQALDYLSNLRFTKEETNYLKTLGLFEDEFLQYLEGFHFKADVWALEDPEIVFAGEPILRVSGNLIEAQIVESCLLNIINLSTTLATKAARVVLAACGRDIYDFSFRRTQGREASLEAAKLGFIAGIKGTSNVYAGYLFNIPVAGTMAHSFIMTFNREIESFLAFAKQFPMRSIFLVDTYDVNTGINSAVKVAKYIKARGGKLIGLRLDSGNLLKDSVYARKVLDKQDLKDVLILASGDLDEYKIRDLVSKSAPINAFGVGSNMGCSSDLPFSDVIYKLIEIKDNNGKIIPTMKLSPDKVTFPGIKELFRVYDKKGIIKNDCIGLAGENIEGKKLLRHCMENGQKLYKTTQLAEKRIILADKLKTLPKDLKAIKDNYKLPIYFTKKIKSFIETCKKKVEVRTKDKIVFLDIDSQNDFLKPKGCLYLKDSRIIIDNIIKLAKFAKKNKITIISSCDRHEKTDEELLKWPSHCLSGTQGQKKITGTVIKQHKIIAMDKILSFIELKSIADNYPQIILEKNVLNVFANPNTLELLEAIFPDHIYIYGVVTELCVKEAVEEILNNGFAVTIIEDAIKEISPKEKNKLFSFWKKKGVGFIKTEQLIQRVIR